MARTAPRRARAALLLTALILLGLSCGDFSPDESFWWGPGGGPSSTNPEQMIQDLIAAGGGWGGERWRSNVLEIVVIDALTRTPIQGADVIVGNGSGSNNYFHATTGTDGRTTLDLNMLSTSGVTTNVVTASMSGYESLTVQHGEVFIYVLPLRPNTANAYAQVRGTVSNVTSSAYRKFEASLSTAVRPLDGEGTRLDRDGFNSGGGFSFYCVPDRPAILSILERDSGGAWNHTQEQTGAPSAGMIDNRGPVLPGSTPPVTTVANGDFFTFNRGTDAFNTYDLKSARARVIGFRSGDDAPLVLGSTEVNSASDDFDLRAIDPGGLEGHRGHLHLEAVFQEGEEVQGTCDAFWDLPDLATGPALHIGIPGLPSIQNPQTGAKDQPPGPQFSWYAWGGAVEGFFEVQIRDRLKPFPENLAWRFWTPVDTWSLSNGFSLGVLDFDSASLPVKHLEFDRDYEWRLVRFRIPTQNQTTDPLYYGRTYRNASFVNRTKWHPFLIDIAGEDAGQFTADTLNALQAEGGGVRGSRTNINTVFVRVFDELTGNPLPSAGLYIGRDSTDNRALNGNGEAAYDPGNVMADDPWTLTACHTNYENTTFFDFNGNIVAIPLRPVSTTDYARVSGSANNVGSDPSWKGAVSALHGRDGGMLEITSEGQPFTLWLDPNRTIHFTALVHEFGSLTDFNHVSIGPYNPGQTGGHSPNFTGTPQLPVVPVQDGGQGVLSGFNSITAGRAYLRGSGADRQAPWRSLLVGLGDTATGNRLYTLDAVRLREVRSLKTELRYAGSDSVSTNGSVVVTLPVTDLTRIPPPVNVPVFPVLNQPMNGTNPAPIRPDFQYSPNSWANDKSGLSVMYIRDTVSGFPGHMKWRFFQWPNDGGTWVKPPAVPAAYELA
ncbi:MAG: hypothetical protein ACYS47_14285, partial [Planctomycetota bacterium]